MPFGNSLPQIEEGSTLIKLFKLCQIERTQFRNIGKWDVARVEDMSSMFYDARNFNSDISKWDVARVEDMRWMFRDARNFNSDISKWNVDRVEDMGWMFGYAGNFNSDISKWDVSKGGGAVADVRECSEL